MPIWLDAPLQHGPYTGRETLGDSVQDITGDPARTVSDISVRAAVARAVTELPDSERTIIAWFYMGQTTFRAIGGRLGISKQRVSQLAARAENKLRNFARREALEALEI